MSSLCLCRICGERTRQSGCKGCCRRCARESGLLAPTKWEQRREVRAVEVQLPALESPSMPRLTRTTVIAGVEYEIVFDGT